MIVDISILHKFNDRDFRIEPIQYKENIELDELKAEIEKITHTQIATCEFNVLVDTKFLQIETPDINYLFKIV